MQFRLLFVIISLLLTLLCLVQLTLYMLISPGSGNQNRIIIWWAPFSSNEKESKSCGAYTCLLTSDRSYYNDSNLGAYLFYGSSIKFYDLPLPKGNIPWAIYHEESPKNLPLLVSKTGQRFFDIISTFDRYSHFPTTLQYLHDINSLIDLQYFIPVENKNQLTIAPILYIQSGCETPTQRDLYVQELMRYIPIDSYGTCLNNKKLPDELKINGPYDIYEEKLLKFVAQYKFTIAIENAICVDYITEKLWRPLMVGSVPIYLGSPAVKDWLPNKNSAILINEFTSMKALAKYLYTLNNDDHLYNEYLQHKIGENKDARITNNLLIEFMGKRKTSISDFECFVCSVISGKQKLKKSSINLYNCPRPIDQFGVANTWKQHWDIGKCQSKLLHNVLTNITVYNYTEDIFDKLVLQNLMKNEC